MVYRNDLYQREKYNRRENAMSRQDWAIIILWGLAIAIIFVAAAVGLKSAVENVTKIIAAVIGAVALVVSAIVTHALNQAREFQFEKYKQRQSNYATLLTQVEAFVQKKEHGQDALDSAHLYSWVVGSEEVIRATQKFLENATQQSLKDLLVAMRKDVGLGGVKADLVPQVFRAQNRPGLPATR